MKKQTRGHGDTETRREGPVGRSPFDRIDNKIGQMLDKSMAFLTAALVLMQQRERLHQVRFENMTAQVLLWKHRAAAHKAHTTMAKQRSLVRGKPDLQPAVDFVKKAEAFGFTFDDAKGLKKACAKLPVYKLKGV